MRRDEVSAALQTLKGIRKTTADQYASKLLRVYDVVGPPLISLDWSWLTNTRAVETFLRDQEDMLDGTKSNYFKAVIAACDCFMPEERAVRDYYADRMTELNQREHRSAMHQDLRHKEVGRWPAPKEVEKNMYLLNVMYKSCPGVRIWDHRHLLYLLYTTMKDTCVFRLDVVYTTKVVKASDYYGKLDNPCNTHNYFVYDAHGVTLAMCHYKTSAKHGVKYIPLPKEFYDVFMLSLRTFPRTWFLPSVRDPDLPMAQAQASLFVKECWLADSRINKPTADDIRSSLATRFWVLNDSIMARDRFADMSMSSRQTMEVYYFKVDDEVKADILSRARAPVSVAELEALGDIPLYGGKRKRS